MKLGDIVEVTVDLSKENLTRGVTGTIVECYEDGEYEVEFADKDG